jgi:dihydroorotate dehydrogenase electron transfer subunit
VSLDDIPPCSSLVILPATTDTRARAITIDATIVSHDHAADRYWRLELLAPQVARTVQPGQFVMITPARRSETWPVLPRPMAVYDADAEAGTLTILYGVVGAGTRHLRGFRAEESLVTVGPLGRPFSLPPTARSLLVLGRGIGSCSLTLLAAAAHRVGLSVTAVASSRHPEATFSGDFYRSHGISSLQVFDSDRSSEPEALRATLAARGTVADVIAVCGSRRLTRLGYELGTEWGAEVQVSLEAHMACGLGYCHGCATGSRSTVAEAPLICRDGPVFRLSDRTDTVHV